MKQTPSKRTRTEMCPMQGGTTMKLRRFIIPFLLAAFLLVGASAALSAEKEATDQKKDPWA